MARYSHPNQPKNLQAKSGRPRNTSTLEQGTVPVDAPTPGSPAAPPMRAKRRDRAANRRKPLPFNPKVRLGIGLAAGVIIAGVTAPLYLSVSPWIGVTIIFLSAVVWHMVESARYYPPIPHIVVFYSGVQMVLMAWVAYYFPHSNPTYHIGEGGSKIPYYLTYGAPAFICFGLGWFVPLMRIKLAPPGEAPSGYQGANLARIFDLMIFGGMGVTLASKFLYIPGLGFVILLAAYLKYVGVLGYIVLGPKGWQWRTALVLGLEAAISTQMGMFGGMVLWLGSIACFVLCFRTVSKFVLIAFVAGLLLGLPALEQAKLKIRAVTWGQSYETAEVFGMKVPDGGPTLPFYWGLILVEEFFDTVTLNLDQEDLQHLGIRHNHGWIVHSVMAWTPENEPYAKGKTLITAAIASIVPRVLAPNKYQAGGGEFFTRFTGHSLLNREGRRGTSMNLGYAGELYANFGHIGGIVASGVYGLLLGCGFAWFVRRGRRNPLVWILWPYIFYFAMKSETGMGEVFNWITKSIVFLIAVLIVLPSLREGLGLRKASTTRQLRPGPAA